MGKLSCFGKRSFPRLPAISHPVDSQKRRGLSMKIIATLQPHIRTLFARVSRHRLSRTFRTHMHTPFIGCAFVRCAINAGVVE
jgi:hypothetical protein